MNLNFDLRGNLKPYDKIELDYDQFRDFFIDKFELSETRLEIFENYKRYIKDFQHEITPSFTQWINGSFVSNKMNPRDIDFVTLIDFKIYEENEKLIESKFRKYGAKNHYERIDAYCVKIYPEDHKKSSISKYDLVYWRNWFSETKKNRAKKKFPKGFIELKFGNTKS